MKKTYGLTRAALFVLFALPSLAIAAGAVSWTPPTTNTDGTAITGAITYNLYQGLAGALVKVQSGLSGVSVTVTAGLTVGTTQCFSVTAVVAAQESGQSTPACILIPLPKPNAPSAVTITLH